MGFPNRSPAHVALVNAPDKLCRPERTLTLATRSERRDFASDPEDMNTPIAMRRSKLIQLQGDTE
jgi:hypothetical protein